MNRASNVEFVVWLIVAVVVMVAKGLGKLATPPEKPATPANPTWPPPQPKPVVRQPTRRPTRRPDAETAPVIQAATPAVVAEKAAPKPAAAVPPARPTRALQWATALRDQQNVRNVIIANEIIGKPVTLREG